MVSQSLDSSKKISDTIITGLLTNQRERTSKPQSIVKIIANYAPSPRKKGKWVSTIVKVPQKSFVPSILLRTWYETFLGRYKEYAEGGSKPDGILEQINTWFIRSEKIPAGNVEIRS